MVTVITIDGPSGAGKGTISRMLADKLGFHYLDSGALYRLLGLAAVRHSVDLANPSSLSVLAGHMDIDFDTSAKGLKVILEGENVTTELRSENTAALASQVASYPMVRTALLQRQQLFARSPGLIADGRDMGTVVFPDAPLKIFLTASAEARAERRLLQLQGMGESVSLARLLADIEERDARDRNRLASPLVAAEDAIVVDSTNLTADAVMHLVRDLAVSRGIAEE